MMLTQLLPASDRQQRSLNQESEHDQDLLQRKKLLPKNHLLQEALQNVRHVEEDNSSILFNITDCWFGTWVRNIP